MTSLKQISPLEEDLVYAIKELREKRGVSQKDLCDALGFEKSFIGNVESFKSNTRYNLEHLYLIAAFFKVLPGELFPKAPYEVVPEVEERFSQVRKKVAIKNAAKVAKKKKTDNL